MKTPTLVAAAIAAAAAAAATTYRFDDLKNPAGSAAPLIDVGDYQGLNFHMRLGSRTPGLTVVAGVIPHSLPNYIIFGNESTLLDGPATITPATTLPATASFALHSMYYGCELAVATDNVNLPMSCRIRVAGYDAGGRRVASQAFAYASRGGTNQSQERGVFDARFRGLRKVVFEYEAAVVPLTGVVMDDFVATVQRR